MAIIADDESEVPSKVDILAFERRKNENIQLAFSSGPLTFARRCLSSAIGQSQNHTSAALQGLDDLCWFMLPELKRCITQYAEDLMMETVSQVKLDTWSGVHSGFRELQVDPLFGDMTESRHDLEISKSCDSNEGTTGSSFAWMTLAISHFVREVMVLLWAEEEVLMEPGFQGEDEEDESGGACIETEDDDDDEEEEFTLCELEPVAVVCILRLMVVYSLELERVALHARTRNFSRTQIEVLRRALPPLLTVRFPPYLGL